ncbi:MAG: hypothetical protein J6N18_10655 [Kiritimatiellae bacterium]|nr:hypothetical protein [Kiritimatiellia bacterium]
MARDYHREYLQQSQKLDYLQIRIPRELKEAYKAACAAGNVQMSTPILDFIRAYIESRA